MKRYLVLKVYETTTPCVLFMSDSLEDATAYATIMSHQDSYEYAVVDSANAWRTKNE